MHSIVNKQLILEILEMFVRWGWNVTTDHSMQSFWLRDSYINIHPSIHLQQFFFFTILQSSTERVQYQTNIYPHSNISLLCSKWENYLPNKKWKIKKFFFYFPFISSYMPEWNDSNKVYDEFLPMFVTCEMITVEYKHTGRQDIKNC